MESLRKPRILIVDDDESVLASLTLLLKQSGYSALTCESPEQALALLARQSVDLVLQDMNFSLHTSGEEGVVLLRNIKEKYPALPVLLMTAWGSIALAVKGVKAGAADFFTKPWHNAQLIQLINTTLALAQPATSESLDRATLAAQFQFDHIVGEHPELLKVLATALRIAKTRASVLILGESGTGKELIADAIHRNSPRAHSPAVKINMGAITSSLFESEMFGHVKGAFTDAKSERKGHIAAAHQSTLFLDEIGELARADQVKLLRVLQDQSYQPVGSSRSEQADIRIISATNKELAELVGSGEFREDLYYRLNLITLRLPPLRERRSDIPLLARHLLQQIAVDYGLGAIDLSASAMNFLSAQNWPGNIRQLKQTLERTALLAGKTTLDQSDFAVLAAEFDSAVDSSADNAARTALTGTDLTLDQVERQMIENALAKHQHNISRVAKALGLSRAALYRRLEKHGLVSADDAAINTEHHDHGAGA